MTQVEPVTFADPCMWRQDDPQHTRRGLPHCEHLTKTDTARALAGTGAGGNQERTFHCCWCGRARVERYSLRRPEGHGSHAPKEWVRG